MPLRHGGFLVIRCAVFFGTHGTPRTSGVARCILPNVQLLAATVDDSSRSRKLGAWQWELPRADFHAPSLPACRTTDPDIPPTLLRAPMATTTSTSKRRKPGGAVQTP